MIGIPVVVLSPNSSFSSPNCRQPLLQRTKSLPTLERPSVTTQRSAALDAYVPTAAAGSRSLGSWGRAKLDALVPPEQPGFRIPALLRGRIGNACDDVNNRLGWVPQHGLQQAACVGGALMSITGIALGLSGLHLGGLAVAGIGIAMLAVCITLGIAANYLARRSRLPGVREGAYPRLLAYRAELQALGCPKNHPVAVQLDKTIAMIDGGVAYTALQIVRGTMLQVFLLAAESVVGWRRGRQAAATAA